MDLGLLFSENLFAYLLKIWKGAVILELERLMFKNKKFIQGNKLKSSSKSICTVKFYEV